MKTAKELIKAMGWDWKETESAARRVAEFAANELNNEEALGDELMLALSDIIEIDKRDLTNSEYDGYFEAAKEALDKYYLNRKKQ